MGTKRLLALFCTNVHAGLLLFLLSNSGASGSPLQSLGEEVSSLPAAVWWVLQAGNGDIWFGSPTEGLYRSRGKALRRFTVRDGLAHNHLRDLAEDRRGGLLVATAGGVSRFDGKAFRTLRPVVSQWPGEGWKLKKGDVWLRGSMAESPYRFDGETLYDLRFPRHPMGGKAGDGGAPGVGPSDAVYSISRDLRGDVWFGLAEWGLYRFNGRSLDWFYRRDLTETPSGGSIGIRAILQDRRGSYWISNSRQSFRVDPGPEKAGSIQPLRVIEKAGMPNAEGGPQPIYALSMAEDREGSIWMVTYRTGVWRYDGERVTRFPVTYKGREVKLFSVTLDRSGHVWLGTHDAGAYRFNGKSFERFPGDP